MTTNTVVDTYSELADTYDGTANARSCWGTDTERIINLLEPRPTDRAILDVGCGAGGALLALARKAAPGTQFIGVEPAENLRNRAREITGEYDNITLYDGVFEDLPLADKSIDYMFSINAFHWCPDAERGAGEIGRVLRDTGAMDHFFIGRNMGREFIQATTPVFLRFMGPRALLDATMMRQHFTVESAQELFDRHFEPGRVSVTESYITYYDTVDGHLGWWVRIAPQLIAIPEEKRADFDAAIHDSLGRLGPPDRIPYTMHTIRAQIR